MFDSDADNVLLSSTFKAFTAILCVVSERGDQQSLTIPPNPMLIDVTSGLLVPHPLTHHRHLQHLLPSALKVPWATRQRCLLAAYHPLQPLGKLRYHHQVTP